MKVVTRKVLTMGGLETKEEFTHSLETISLIVLWNDNLICWYEKRIHTKLNEIRGKVLSCKRTFIIEKSGKKAAYTLDGTEIIPFDNYDYIVEYCHAIKVSKNNLVGAFSYDGKEIVPLIYSNLIFDKYGISPTIGGGIRKGLNSYRGEIIVPYNYTIRCINKDIMLCSNQDDLYGVYSLDGEIIVPCEYDSIALYENCMLVEKDSKVGMLSYSDEVVLPIMFCNISEVSTDNHDYYIAEREDKAGFGLYKYNGKEILPAIYDEMYYEDKDCVLVIKDGYCGLYNIYGIELLKPIYECITNNGDNIFEVKSAGGKRYYISSINRIIYADDVRYIDNSYIAFKDGVWTIIEE